MKKHITLLFVLVICLFVQIQTSFAQTSATELLARAKASIEKKDYQPAVKDLTELIKLEAKNSEAFATRAHALVMLGNYDGAVVDSSKAIEINPNFGWAYYLRGLAKMWNGKPDMQGALTDFAKVIKFDDKLASEAYRYRAGIYNEFYKDYAAALSEANEAIRLNPNNANIFAQRGLANTELKNYDQALLDYRQAIKLGFVDSGAYTSLSFLEYRLKHYAQAEADVRQALKINPDNQQAKNNLAGILAAQAALDKISAEALKQQQTNDTSGKNKTSDGSNNTDGLIFNNLDVKALYKQAQADNVKRDQAQALYDRGDYAGAIKLLTELVDGSLMNTTDRGLRAAAYYKLKDYKKALKDIDDTIEMSRGKATSGDYALRGDVYKAENNNVKAESDYHNALELDPNNQALKQKLKELNPNAEFVSGGSNLAAIKNFQRELQATLDKFDSLKPVYEKKTADFYALIEVEKQKKGNVDSAGLCRLLLNVKADWKSLDPMIDNLSDKTSDLQKQNKFDEYFSDTIQLVKVTEMITWSQETYIPGKVEYVFWFDKLGCKAMEKPSESINNEANGKSCGEKDYDCQIAAASKAIQANPNDAAAYVKRGNAYDEKGNSNQAILDYNKAIELDPKNASAYYNRAIVYANKDDSGQAILDYSKAIELNRKYAPAYDNRGDLYLKRNLFYLAAADFTEAVELKPDDKVDQDDLKVALARQQNNQTAATAPSPQITISGKTADEYMQQGNVYYDNKQYAEALAEYTKAAELEPQNYLPYYNRGNAYDEQGKSDLAIADYTKAIDLNPRYDKAYYNRGITYTKRNNYDLAIADYTKAIELNPQHYNAYGNRGIAYSQQEKYDLALADFSKSISLKPTDGVSYARRAVIYCAQGNKELAVLDEKKAIFLGAKLLMKCE